MESTSNRVGIGSILPGFDLSFGGDVDRILGLERHSTADTAGNDITVQSGGATTCTVTPASTGFACSSDERLKKDIEEFSDALSLKTF